LAVYHCSVKVFSRSNGACAVAKAAYRAGQELRDDLTNRTHDYTDKPGVIDTMILAPDSAPEWAKDRERLWNAVQAAEKRVDAREAREVRVALPVELTAGQQKQLVRCFVMDQFVGAGMVADVAIHEAHVENPTPTSCSRLAASAPRVSARRSGSGTAVNY